MLAEHIRNRRFVLRRRPSPCWHLRRPYHRGWRGRSEKSELGWQRACLTSRSSRPFTRYAGSRQLSFVVNAKGLRAALRRCDLGAELPPLGRSATFGTRPKVTTGDLR